MGLTQNFITNEKQDTQGYFKDNEGLRCCRATQTHIWQALFNEQRWKILVGGGYLLGWEDETDAIEKDKTKHV